MPFLNYKGRVFSTHERDAITKELNTELSTVSFENISVIPPKYYYYIMIVGSGGRLPEQTSFPSLKP
ncbi:hypothetical protein SAMN04487897_1444 [Paenibacillus sp. yr247]|nr:hypothetical protein SAMN04487897_1444 [Paenibacillus sp. yr247]